MDVNNPTYPFVSFHRLVNELKTSLGHEPFVLQIGAMDGVRFDLLHPHLAQGGWRGLLVEPMPDMFEKLKKTYAMQRQLKLANCAVTQYNGMLTLRRVNPEAISKGFIPEEALGITSMFTDRGILGHPKFAQLYPEVVQNYVQDVEVSCFTLSTLLAQNVVEVLDLVVIDTEGADWIIAQQIDLAKYRPALICLEYDALSQEEFKECCAYFVGHEYTAFICDEDRQNILFYKI